MKVIVMNENKSGLDFEKLRKVVKSDRTEYEIPLELPDGSPAYITNLTSPDGYSWVSAMLYTDEYDPDVIDSFVDINKDDGDQIMYTKAVDKDSGMKDLKTISNMLSKMTAIDKDNVSDLVKFLKSKGYKEI